jgi:hypothetical protein
MLKKRMALVKSLERLIATLQAVIRGTIVAQKPLISKLRENYIPVNVIERSSVGEDL